MKKALFLVFVIPLLVSCEINQQSTIQVFYANVTPSDWHAEVDDNGTNLFYYCTVNVPEITSKVCSNGLVNVFYLIKQSQQALPYERHYESADLYTWTRTIDFDYTTGTLTIYATRSDFVVDPPPAMEFRIVIQE